MRIWETSKATDKRIYVVIDDTISEKTVPSSKAKKPTEKCGFHNSHLKGKTVYGHQLVTVMLLCDTLVLPYTMAIYDKENMSKIQMAIKFINSLPPPVSKGYVLCDSWYSNKKLFAVSKEALFKDGCLRAFITLDTSLTTEELLNHYKHRWPIETFFRETKKYLGLNHYQGRSSRSIKRYFLLLMMTYIHCELEVSDSTLILALDLRLQETKLKKSKYYGFLTRLL